MIHSDAGGPSVATGAGCGSDDAGGLYNTDTTVFQPGREGSVDSAR